MVKMKFEHSCYQGHINTIYDILRNDLIGHNTSMLTVIYKITQCNWDKGIANKCEVHNMMLGVRGREGCEINDHKRKANIGSTVWEFWKRTVAHQEQCDGNLYENICWEFNDGQKIK